MFYDIINLFFLVLFQHNWHTALYMFKLYRVTIWLTHSMQCLQVKIQHLISTQKYIFLRREPLGWIYFLDSFHIYPKYGTLHKFACHPYAGALLIFSVSFDFIICVAEASIIYFLNVYFGRQMPILSNKAILFKKFFIS